MDDGGQLSSTYHASVISIVNGSNELAVISASTQLGPNRGCLKTYVISAADGIPRGRTNVSTATTSGGGYLDYRVKEQY